MFSNVIRQVQVVANDDVVCLHVCDCLSICHDLSLKRMGANLRTSATCASHLASLQQSHLSSWWIKGFPKNPKERFERKSRPKAPPSSPLLSKPVCFLEFLCFRMFLGLCLMEN